jgi:hypothetical protein
MDARTGSLTYMYRNTTEKSSPTYWSSQEHYEKYNQEQLTEEDVAATMSTIQHDHLPNGVRDNPAGIYTTYTMPLIVV